MSSHHKLKPSYQKNYSLHRNILIFADEHLLKNKENMKSTLFWTVLFLLASKNIDAQVSFKAEYFGTSSYWHETGEDSREKIGNCKGSAVVYQGSINIPLLVKNTKYDRPTIWSVGINGAYASLNNKNFTGDYDGMVINEMMNIALGLSYMRPLSEKWSLITSLGAGIYAPSTNLSKIRYKHLLGNVAVLFIRHLKSNMEVGGGIAINSTFGYPMVFPALYFNWNSDGRFNFKISVVDGLNLAAGYDINKFLDLSLVVEMSGQSAFTEKDGEDVTFSHQYFIAGVRPEIKLGNKVSIPITAGMHLIRSGFYSERTLKGMFSNDDYYFQASPYVSAGIKIGF